MGKMSRNKGKVGERELAAELCKLGIRGARRGVQYSGGGESPDVIGLEPYCIHIECKRVERLDLTAAMAQAINDCGGKTPIVCHRKNRGKWMVTCHLDDFIRILTQEDLS